MSDFAKESGHWYAWDGTPKYTITGKNGKERNTTLRDARIGGLVPSVTTILKVADKPALNRWKENQILLAALTLPKVDCETVDEFSYRVWQDANQQSIDAREEGSRIHGAVESSFLNGESNPEFDVHVNAVHKELSRLYGPQHWQAEKSVVSNLGYGGKVDLHSIDVVIDYKTKDFVEDNLPNGYDEQCMQLAAYRNCINPAAKCANVFISRNNPGLVHVVEWTEDELQRGFKMFRALLEYWKLQKNYHPTPTQGGILTTPEREALKSNEMSEARKQVLGE